jgi:hypothetical protein
MIIQDDDKALADWCLRQKSSEHPEELKNAQSSGKTYHRNVNFKFLFNFNTGCPTVGCWRFGAVKSVRSAKSSSTHQKTLLCLVFAWQSGNFCVFRSKRCWELKSSFLVVEEYILEKFWYKESTKRMKMVEMTGRLFKFNSWISYCNFIYY